MSLESLLHELLILIVAAVGVVVVCARARIPPVAGLLVTGLLIGPSGLGLVAEPEQVETFAELGVILLLFAIGLEVSFARLRELRHPILVGGGLQALLTGILATALGFALGWPPNLAVFLGFVLICSSTALVLKLYADRDETDTPQGRLVLAILLFQDVLVVPLMVVTPLLASEGSGALAESLLRFGGGAAAVAAAFAVARWALPWVLDHLVQTRIREVLVLGALGVCLAMASLAHELGFSLALGAFLAGVIVAETPYQHQIVADIGPFRDLFASIFFISIGMLVDIDFALGHWQRLGALAVAAIVLKALALWGAARWSGYSARIATVVALGLAQIGEFSFVLMELGREVGLLDTPRFQLLLAAAVVSLLAAPALIQVAPRIAILLDRRVLPTTAAPQEESLTGHVVIVGFGFGGRLVARVLDAAGVRWTAIELNAGIVRPQVARGLPVHFGDASRSEVLAHAGVPSARVVVLAISDPWMVQRVTRQVRDLSPSASIIVRSRRVDEIDRLRAEGADHVVAEELEAALVVFTRVLEAYHLPRNVIRAEIRALRAEGYELLRTPDPGRDVSKAVLEALAAGTTDLFLVASDSHVAGQTLAQLDLRRKTGASVISVVRGETSYPSPTSEMTLEAGDCLVLVGSHESIESAFVALERPSS